VVRGRRPPFWRSVWLMPWAIAEEPVVGWWPLSDRWPSRSCPRSAPWRGRARRACSIRPWSA
jgi:hypothetical protein